MFSSADNQPSLESKDLKHGVFTYYLLDGFVMGEDLNRDGRISLAEAFAYARQKVSDHTQQLQVPAHKVTGSIEEMPVGRRR
jgi:uncharacterized caspase-like protein